MTSRPLSRLTNKQFIAAGALLVLTTGCQNMPGASSRSSSESTVSSAVNSCLTGAFLAGVGDMIIDRISGKKVTNDAATTKKKMEVVVKGCVIGIAVTVIGKMLNSAQQQKYEEAMQRDAERRSKEQAAYETARRSVESRSTTNAKQAQAKDEELARLQREYEASMARPVTNDLGGGATVVTQGSPPITTGDFAGCQRKTNLVTTPAGQARQEELHCPNETGKLVRVEAKTA
ncbi:hypothetical protein [Roseateles sp.]|uniref:hypothetical protein n=1 Tax=Roseateles sp. TaxID=1971397 RepID=UPI003D1485EB